MRTSTSTTRLAMIVLLVSFGTVFAGETVTYRGKGTFMALRVLLPLSNGGAAVHVSNDTVATIEPSASGFIFGDCAGLGYISPQADLTIDSYCTFSESAEDSFDLKNKSGPTGGTVEVIGGSGKWAGATGSGSFKRTFVDGDRGSYEYELKITTP